jgi:ABC-2 type transport system ATP-binding protein
MMVGLVNPDSGAIKIGGYDMSQDPINAKSILAYIPEKGYIFEKLTAWEYLTFISGIYDLDDDAFRKNASEYLDIFGLSGWKDEIIGNFSMGMKQRLLLTSSFMRNPKVIILDEPHNGLDPKGVRILKDTLFKLRNNGATILLSTHIIAIAEQICDKIAIINKGSVSAEGTNEDLKHYAKSTDKDLEDIFLRLTSDYERV